jgi:glycosyltransferase involved in cell wall biosynthesis
MIGDEQGEIGRLVRQDRCCVVITPGDAATLADTLRRWSEAPQTLAEMGARARQMLEEKFTKAQAVARWSQVVDHLAAAGY